MFGWELLLVALGGALIGVGIGLVIGRHRELGLRRRLTAHITALRGTVIPLLEKRADTIGLPSNQRGADIDDPMEVVCVLASCIQRHAEAEHLPFSDTLELSRETLKAFNKEKDHR